MDPYPVTKALFASSVESLKVNFDYGIADADLKEVLRNYKLAFDPTTDPPDERRPVNDEAWRRTVRRLLLERDYPGMPRLAEVVVRFRQERDHVEAERSGEAFIADLEARRAARR